MGATGAGGRLRVNAASRIHWEGMCIIVALARRAAYSVAERCTPMVRYKVAPDRLRDGHRSVCTRVCR
jgi:hypothetical protein